MYTLTIKLLSPTLLMSGQGDVITDSTIVHDRYGIPYIPAKRVRGVLYESALEVAEMMELSNLNTFTIKDVNILFNRANEEDGEVAIYDNPRLSISNLVIPDYDTVARDIATLQNHKDCQQIFTKERILEEYTSMRYYTSIDQSTGAAMEGTLHNSRVLNKGCVFSGAIDVEQITDLERIILACAARNLSGIGGKRNRGFGQVECTIEHESFDLDVLGGTLWSK